MDDSMQHRLRIVWLGLLLVALLLAGTVTVQGASVPGGTLPSARQVERVGIDIPPGRYRCRYHSESPFANRRVSVSIVVWRDGRQHKWRGAVRTLPKLPVVRMWVKRGDHVRFTNCTPKRVALDVQP